MFTALHEPVVMPESHVSWGSAPSNEHKNDIFFKKKDHEARKHYIAIRYIMSVVSYGIICIFWNNPKRTNPAKPLFISLSGALHPLRVLDPGPCGLIKIKPMALH